MTSDGLITKAIQNGLLDLLRSAGVYHDVMEAGKTRVLVIEDASYMSPGSPESFKDQLLELNVDENDIKSVKIFDQPWADTDTPTIKADDLLKNMRLLQDCGKIDRKEECQSEPKYDEGGVNKTKILECAELVKQAGNKKMNENAAKQKENVQKWLSGADGKQAPVKLITANGGNFPALLYVLGNIPEFMEAVAQMQTNIVWAGRSAGSMMLETIHLSAEFSSSYESLSGALFPDAFEQSEDGCMKAKIKEDVPFYKGGDGLIGECNILPHAEGETWDTSESEFETISELYGSKIMVPVRWNEALKCDDEDCTFISALDPGEQDEIQNKKGWAGDKQARKVVQPVCDKARSGFKRGYQNGDQVACFGGEIQTHLAPCEIDLASSFLDISKESRTQTSIATEAATSQQISTEDPQSQCPYNCDMYPYRYACCAQQRQKSNLVTVVIFAVIVALVLIGALILCCCQKRWLCFKTCCIRAGVNDDAALERKKQRKTRRQNVQDAYRKDPYNYQPGIYRVDDTGVIRDTSALLNNHQIP